jgi:hypothetical protein
MFLLAYLPVITHYPTDQIVAFAPSLFGRWSLPRVHEQDTGAKRGLVDYFNILSCRLNADINGRSGAL